MVLITDVPPELISSLPNYLCSLDDWYALIRTSRYFYISCANTTARFPPVFQERDGRPLFPPHPHMLLSGIARQIADWAVQSDDNRQTLEETLERGNVGLLDLGAQVAMLSVQDVRALHRDKIEVVKPFGERVHRELKNRIFERINTTGLRATPEACAYHHLIYCELFHHEVDRVLGKNRDQHFPLSLTTRRRWIERSINTPKPILSARVGRDEVQSIAGTFSNSQSLESSTDSEDLVENTIDLWYVGFSDTWWSIKEYMLQYPLLKYCGHAFSALEHQGIDSLRLKLSLSKADAERLPSEAEELLDEAVRSLDEEVELPQFFDMMNDFGQILRYAPR